MKAHVARAPSTSVYWSSSVGFRLLLRAFLFVHHPPPGDVYVIDCSYIACRRTSFPAENGFRMLFFDGVCGGPRVPCFFIARAPSTTRVFIGCFSFVLRCYMLACLFVHHSSGGVYVIDCSYIACRRVRVSAVGDWFSNGAVSMVVHSERTR